MKTILIVDDIPENIKIMKELLENANYNVKISTNGKKALEIVNSSNNRPDLIILDIIMPEMDGYEVCKQLKSNNSTKDIPIIFATAKDEVEDETYGFELGAVDYISKPISGAILLARVKTHLKMQSLLVHLEKRVNEETKLRIYHEKILLQQNKMAMMGEMIDAIMHQCSQPLSIISMENQFMNLNMNEEKIDKKYIENFSTKIEKQLEHTFQTMKDFRNFFRPNTLDYNFSLNNSISKTIELIKSDLIKNLIEIDCELYEKDIVVSGNENEFKHILINLINNARDAFIENKITNRKIKIKLTKDKEKIIMKISDNAGGIPKEIIKHIFKANMTTKQNGTGVGLYLSLQIANKLGANISAKNIDNGCEFIFEKRVDNVA